jgi:phosphinothricin acetyltransferase
MDVETRASRIFHRSNEWVHEFICKETPMTTTTRLATLIDLPSIVRIYNQSVPERNATCELTPATLEDRIPWFHAHDSRHPLWVAETRGRIVGWASISPYSEREGYRLSVENSVYVDQSMRGIGIGEMLLGLTVNESRRLGYHAILARVFAHNPASIRLHQKLGFQEMGNLREIANMDGVFRDVLFLVLLLEQDEAPEPE